MIKEIIVLTRSDKHRNPIEGGYCVTGLDINNPSDWIRLIGLHDSFKITNYEAVYENGELCEPLDVIRVNVTKADKDGWLAGEEKYKASYNNNLYSVQPENYIVRNKFEFVRKASIEEVLNTALLSNKRNIFLNDSNSLSIEEAILNNHSLVLVKAENLRLYPEEKMGNYRNHYKASFRYNGIEYNNIACTDPEYEATEKQYRELNFGDTYLIISLGGEFNGRHYKLIAKIFEVVYTIENNTYNYYHAFSKCRYLRNYKDSLRRELIKNLEMNGMIKCSACSDRNCKELYSIGHSKLDFNEFLSLLKKFDVNYVIDVRSVPYSKFAEDYNREYLRMLLSDNGIEYYYMGKRFGARREDKSLYTEDNCLDFEKVRKDKYFLEGIDNVIRVLDMNYNIALMCTEKDPMDCHRAIMVSKGFFDAGIEVKHILHDGSIMKQSELEEQLLNKEFPEITQYEKEKETGPGQEKWPFFTFKGEEISKEERIEECYKKRNKKIGYSIAEEKE